jgi:DNA-binding IclR family transcriptional regulator
MPRISPSDNGGSATADRVLSLLTAFKFGDDELTLAQMAWRTGLYKSTALRLLRSLAAAKFIVAIGEGRFRLGGEILRLQAIMNAAGGLESAVMPVLRALVAETRETAALHVRRGSHRIRLFIVESPQPLREHVLIGEELPLERGAGGLVLLAFSEKGKKSLEDVRKQGYAISLGGRIPELSGIAAPVFDARGDLVGALTLTMPTHRWNPSWRNAVIARAAGLTIALGGEPQMYRKGKETKCVDR